MSASRKRKPTARKPPEPGKPPEPAPTFAWPGDPAPEPEPEKLPPEFARIEREAAAAEGEQAAADEPAPEPESTVDYLGQARDLVTMAAGMLLPFYPELQPVWTDAKQTAVAGALAPVLAKYKIALPELLAQWAPELGLAIVVIPLGMETRRALQAAALRRDADKAASATEPAATTTHYAPEAHKPDGTPRGQVQVIPRTEPSSLHTRA